MQVQLIDRELIRQNLSMPRAIELMREAYRELSSAKVESPLRTALVNEHGTVLYKPAYSDQAGIFCVKVVSVFPGNVERNLPVTPGIIVVNSSQTGMPLAVLEAGYLTSLRTGAATGLATDLFAHPESKTAALFGTGGQARHQLEAMLCARPFEKVYVFSRQAENAVRFCRENEDLTHLVKAAGGCQLIANPDRSVLKNCDVITTATTSPVAVFADEEIPQHVHINAIGSLGAQRTEVPAETLLRSQVVVDQRAACLQEAGEICLMRDAGLIGDDYHPLEIGELLDGQDDWNSNDRPSVFKSVGNAAQDLVCSAEIYRQVKEAGSGVLAEL